MLQLISTWFVYCYTYCTSWKFHYIPYFTDFRLQMISLHEIVIAYLNYKIHLHCMKVSSIGLDTENSEDFLQLVMSWNTVTVILWDKFLI